MKPSPYPLIGQILAPARRAARDSSHMKARLCPCRAAGRWFIGCLLIGMLPITSPAQTPPPAPQVAQVKLTPQELSQLLSPIALYPDALIALILPAATVPSDVVLGARYLAGSGDPATVESQGWDESVKSLIRYPEVLSWMDQNLDWTASVGEAFMSQPADVMNAIQALRAQARAAGTLVDTPEQKIVQEEEYIRIIPADPEIIYVPQYDPQIVYVQSYTPAIITFGVGFAVGSWLNYDFDWRQRCIYRGQWRGWDRGWNNNRRGGVGNSVNVVNINVNNASRWQPSSASVRQVSQRQRNNNGNARIANARVQQAPPTATANLPAGAQFDPGRTTGVPRPSLLNTGNDRRQRGERPDRPTTARPGGSPNTVIEGAPTTPGNPVVRGNRPPTVPPPPNLSNPQPVSTPPAGQTAGQVAGQVPPSGEGQTVEPSAPRGDGSRSQQPRRPRPEQGTVTQNVEPTTPPENRRWPNSGQPSRRLTPSTAAPQVGAETPRTPQMQGGSRSNRPERESRQTTVPPQVPAPVAPVQQPQPVRPEAPSVSQQPREPRQQPQQRPQQQQAPQQIQPQPEQQAPRQQQRQFQQQRPQPQQVPQQVPQQRQERVRPQMPEMRQAPAPSAQGAQMQVPQNRGGNPMGGGRGSGEGRRQQQQQPQQ